MSRTKHIAWMAALSVATVLAAGAHGSMIGIGREGDFALEIFSERSEVVRRAGKTSVTLPDEAEGLFRAADVRPGDPVWTGMAGPAEKPTAAVERLVSGWWSCELKLKEPVRSDPVPVERFHLVRWTELGRRFSLRLDGLAQTNEAAWRDGLENVLSCACSLFWGESMVAGFPGTKYAAEYRNVKRAVDRCVRKGQMQGFGADRSLRNAYHTLFDADWPTVFPAVFFAGSDRPLEIRRITGADGRPVPDVFDSPLPIRLEGGTCAEGMLPANMELKISYSMAKDAADGADASEQVFAWSTAGDDRGTVWFMLQPTDAGVGVSVSTNLLENAGSVALSVHMNLGGLVRTGTLSASDRAMLCLVTRPGIRLGVDAMPAASDPFARDWSVAARKEAGSVVRFDTLRKAEPELVLNNPEMMPVDVTVTPVGGGWGSATKLTLKAGESGVGVPVPAHKPLVVTSRFRSDFHKAGSSEIPPLFYGDRTNLVLRAELKGDPEVIVQNTGPVAVRLTGMATPAGHVDILPGKSAKVTVPAGKRVVLTGRAAKGDYQCEPISIGAMDSGETTHAKLRMSLKPAPKIILRNTGGMMDVAVTPMSAVGRSIGKSFTVKRGTVSPPMPLPSTPDAYYRLSYSKGRFVSQGRLDIPVIPRGEIRTLDIPNPSDDIRLQTPESPARAAQR